jgi:hypothetical protein
MTSFANNSAIAAFCKELRDARAFQQISLSEVERITRISLESLNALEQGRWEAIPQGFVRGYLMLYAHSVGMNREKVLQTFDRLMMPSGGGQGAELDEAPPLLREPEDVGVTRAKIRTSWFAALSRNRRLLYGLSSLSVIVVLAVLALSRHVEINAIQPLPFSDALVQNSQAIFQPLTIIPLGSISAGQSLSTGKGKWSVWIGTGPGWCRIQQDSLTPRIFRYDAFDTIKIQYDKQLTGRVSPAVSILVFQDSDRISARKTLPGDTALFLLEPATSTVNDSAKTS